ncbi:MAG: helix-turn-helix domain-containing protein [Dehalococcoidia bacterium]
MPKIGHFDAQGFFGALDAERVARQIRWKDVAHESGVSASTLTRMAQGKRPDVDSLAALASWSGLNPGEYVRSTSEPEEPKSIAMISTHLRTDPNLTSEAATALEELIKATYERLRSRKD